MGKKEKRQPVAVKQLGGQMSKLELTLCLAFVVVVIGGFLLNTKKIPEKKPLVANYSVESKFWSGTWSVTNTGVSFVDEENKATQVLACSFRTDYIVDLYELSGDQKEICLVVWNGRQEKTLKIDQALDLDNVIVESVRGATYAQWQTMKKNYGYE
jgi:hypothetical protein